MAKKKAHKRYRVKPTEQFPKGEIVPGVTTIIDSQLGWNKRVLMAWARREALKGNDPDVMAQEAADSGTCTHYHVECHLKDIKPDLKDFTQDQIDKAETGYLAFLEWEKNNKLEYIHLEYPVVSERFRYGGTVDMVAKRNGGLWMIDLKTSKAIYPSHKIQLAAYVHAYNEQEIEPVTEYHILQLNKEDGSFQHHPISQQVLDDSWHVFALCRKLYDLKKRF
jgi:hypothetical protein